ncbi:hypothetical protein NDU88_006515 [Pleurodeles waltl]|uniref:Uncharacterized protein n=1 Tax=Pleurodeles waltl TaxID=8319 RepID=A0AAV7UPX7_PLEWA|nr:hypothetical protein NDU88_006515 [Pleurodeles waltl]
MLEAQRYGRLSTRRQTRRVNSSGLSTSYALTGTALRTLFFFFQRAVKHGVRKRSVSGRLSSQRAAFCQRPVKLRRADRHSTSEVEVEHADTHGVLCRVFIRISLSALVDTAERTIR